MSLRDHLIRNQEQNVPAWRLAVYGLLTASAVGFLINDPQHIVFTWFCAGFSGIVIVGFGLMIQSARRNGRVRQYGALLAWIGVVGHIILVICRLVQNR